MTFIYKFLTALLKKVTGMTDRLKLWRAWHSLEFMTAKPQSLSKKKSSFRGWLNDSDIYCRYGNCTDASSFLSTLRQYFSTYVMISETFKRYIVQVRYNYKMTNISKYKVWISAKPTLNFRLHYSCPGYFEA